MKPHLNPHNVHFYSRKFTIIQQVYEKIRNVLEII